jgi:hypothetical protein
MFCGAEKKNTNSKAQHERLCKQNPNKAEPTRGMLGKRGRDNGAKNRVWTEEQRARMAEASRSRGQSEESRKKIGAARRAYLSEHPEKVPYVLNHYSKGPSYPEKYFKGILEKTGKVFQAEHPFGSYRLDFAFPEARIDLEIDGDQHWLDPKIREHDKRRDEYLISEGWSVIRVLWSSYQKKPLLERELFIKDLLSKLP